MATYKFYKQPDGRLLLVAKRTNGKAVERLYSEADIDQDNLGAVVERAYEHMRTEQPVQRVLQNRAGKPMIEV